MYTDPGPFQTLIITDGVTTVDLLNSRSGFYCQSWTPAVTEPKDGGIYADSPLSDGRNLVSYKFGNVTETFLLTVHNETPNDLIRDTQNIRRLLLKALDGGLVWIEDQAVGEDNPRFMQVVNYRATSDGNPHGTDTFWTKLCSAAFPEWSLEIERKPFCFGNPPGVGQCAEASGGQSGWQYLAWGLSTTAPAGQIFDLLETSGGWLLAADAINGIYRLSPLLVWLAATTTPAPNVACQSMVEMGGFVYLLGKDTLTGQVECWRSGDNGDNWVLRNNNVAGGVATTSSHSLVVFNGAIYAQTSLGIFCSSDGGTTWASVLAGNALSLGVSTVKNLLFACIYTTTTGTPVYQSSDGTTWSSTGLNLYVTFFKKLTDGYFYMIVRDGYVYRTNDGGDTWKLTGQIGGVVTTLEDVIYSNNVYYGVTSVGGPGTVIMSADTYSWVAAATPAGSSYSIERFSNNNRMYVGEAGDIYVSGPLIDVGRTETCLNEIFIANKQNVAQFTHVWEFDTPAWIAHFPSAGFPFNILPAVMVNGDAVVLTTDTTVLDSGPFASAVFDITTTASGTFTLTWYYPSGAGAVWPPPGAGWTALTIQDGTNSFRSLGVNSISFVPPTNWTAVAINGVIGYHIVGVVSGVAAGPTGPQQGNLNLYTANWNHFHVAADQVPGDFQALARLVFNCRGDADGPRGVKPDGWASRFLVAVKPVGDDGVGSSFVSLLNCADEQNPTGISVTAGVGTVFTNDMEAPSGRRMTHTTTGVSQWQDVCTFTIGPSFAVNYYGKHRCIVRAQQVNRTAVQGEVLVRVMIRTGSGGIETVSRASQFPNLNPWQVLDFQQVAIPASELFTNADIADQTQVVVQVWSSVAAGTVYLYELGLFPVDWCFADVQDVAFRDESVVENGFRFDLDSVRDPMHEVRAFVRATGTDLVRSIYNPVCPTPISLEPNTDQNVHVLAMRGEVTGTHTGANNAATLTDSAASFLTSNVRAGQTIWNQSDSSSAMITGVTATTITGTLSGGAENDWDTNDAYTIICPNWKSPPWLLFSVTGEINPRYFSMRGNR